MVGAVVSVLIKAGVKQVSVFRDQKRLQRVGEQAVTTADAAALAELASRRCAQYFNPLAQYLSASKMAQAGRKAAELMFETIATGGLDNFVLAASNCMLAPDLQDSELTAHALVLSVQPQASKMFEMYLEDFLHNRPQQMLAEKVAARSPVFRSVENPKESAKEATILLPDQEEKHSLVSPERQTEQERQTKKKYKSICERCFTAGWIGFLIWMIFTICPTLIIGLSTAFGICHDAKCVSVFFAVIFFPIAALTTIIFGIIKCCVWYHLM